MKNKKNKTLEAQEGTGGCRKDRYIRQAYLGSKWDRAREAIIAAHGDSSGNQSSDVGLKRER